MKKFYALLAALLIAVPMAAGAVLPEKESLGGGCYSYTMCDAEADAELDGEIASIADGSGIVAGYVIITDVAHGITDAMIAAGVEVVIVGPADPAYRGIFTVMTRESADTFTIIATWTATDTGTWTHSGSGACRNAAGTDEIVLRGLGKYAWTFYGTQSVGAYACDVFTNDTGYDANVADKQKLNATSITSTTDLLWTVAGNQQVKSFDGSFDWIWVECPTIGTTATITATVCPL